MSTKISIIIPVYNAAAYLRKCINSVLKQTLVEFEVILVDDNSSDESLQICKDFANRDARCRIFSNRGKGVSSSRNLGIDESRGDYIIFLDADDFWSIDTALETLYNIATHTLSDVVRGQYHLVDINDTLISRLSENQAVEQINISEFEFYKNVVKGEFFIWLSLFKKNAIGDLRFNESRAYLEDMEFYCRLANKNLVYSFIPLRFYSYRKNPQNVSSKFCDKRLIDSLSICYFFDELTYNTIEFQLRNYFRYYSIMMYVSTLELISDDLYYARKKDIISLCSLKAIGADVLKWSKHNKFMNSAIWVLLFTPSISISIIRLRNKFKVWLGRFLKKILSIL